MKNESLLWLDSILEKLWVKHRVDVDEVREVLQDRRTRFHFVEKGHRKGEDVYAGFGRTHSGRYLIVVFIKKKDGESLIVSTRDMTKAERRKYGKK